MAYSQQAGGNPGGSINGSQGPGSAAGDQLAHPQGTEYTLQGVMRFLQIEWHNHERARNAWTIERAEMKAKIAKLEGENRQGKRINEQLVKQIMMLQKVLKAAREGKEKEEAGLGNGMVEGKKDLDGKTEEKVDGDKAKGKL